MMKNRHYLACEMVKNMITDDTKKWVTVDDLDRFSKVDEAPRKLPLFITWLIEATVPSGGIRRIRFLTEEAATVHGIDGILDCDCCGPFVPAGLSVWEFGVSMKGSKASEDMAAAEKKALDDGIDPATATLVLVSLQKWPRKGAWLNTAKTNSRWRDIRAYNAVDIAAWLDSKKSVAFRVAQYVGSIPPGVQTAESYWETWCGLSSFPITGRILLAGRKQATDQFLTDLLGVPKMHILRADSQREALAFAVAAIHSTDSPGRERLLSRMLIARDETVVVQLTGQTGLIIAVERFSSQLSDSLVRRGNHLIVPIGDDLPGLRATVTIARPRRKDFVAALVQEGMEAREAEIKAVECGASATLLQRTLIAESQTVSGVIPPPKWANGEEAFLVPAMLVGGWDESSDADKEVLATIAAMPYADLERGLQRLSTSPEPPIIRIGSVWKITAPTYCFHEMARFITSGQLRTFQACATEVFSEVDPRYRLDPKERAYSFERMRHSNWIRNGMAETVLLISARGGAANISRGVDPNAFVAELIQNVPGLGNDWRVLASLRGQLTTLMEGAPDPLLNALEQLLGGDGSLIRGLFEESEFISPDSPHTGVLWALEMLAWNPTYLPRVASILASLARIDPGGRLANRPLASLAGLFLFWHPKTNAPLSLRLRVLDSVLRQEPTVAWPLLMQLVPSHSGFTMEATPPRWNDAGSSEKEDLTLDLQISGATAIIDRAIQRIGDDPKHWDDILQKVTGFSDSHRTVIYELLDTFADREVSSENKKEVWDSARRLLSHNRSFADAEWALPTDELDRLEKIVDKLAPRGDPIQQYSWMFNDHLLELSNRDYSVIEQESNTRRRDAIANIVAILGVDALFRLIEKVQYPGLVGVAVADFEENVFRLGQIVDRALKNGSAPALLLAASISSRALDRFETRWSETLLTLAREESWTSEQIANAVKLWPDSRSTWNAIESLGADVFDAYWRLKPIFAIRGEAEDLVFALQQFLKVGRAASALPAASLRMKDIPTDLIYRLVEPLLNDPRITEFNPNMLAHYVETALTELAKRTDADVERIASLEFKFFPLIGFSKKNLIIYKLMATSPKLVVDFVSAIYKSETRADTEITDQERKFATYARQILEGWKIVPGTMNGGDMDKDALMAWIATARSLAAAADRGKMMEFEIGKILAYSPPDPEDKSWPHRAVREILETSSTERLERGLHAEDFNKRGVYSKELFEGGGQERAFAEERERWAASIEQHWPRTAKVLRALAADWRAHANREDLRAKEDELRL
jgi:hypothetical protein